MTLLVLVVVTLLLHNRYHDTTQKRRTATRYYGENQNTKQPQHNSDDEILLLLPAPLYDVFRSVTHTTIYHRVVLCSSGRVYIYTHVSCATMILWCYRGYSMIIIIVTFVGPLNNRQPKTTPKNQHSYHKKA